MSAHNEAAGPVLCETRRIIQAIGPIPTTIIACSVLVLIGFMWHTRADAVRSREADAYYRELDALHRQYRDQLTATVTSYSEQLFQRGDQHDKTLSETVANAMQEQAERDNLHRSELRELVAEQKRQIAAMLRREKAVSQVRIASMLKTQERMFVAELAAADARFKKQIADLKPHYAEPSSRNNYAGTAVFARVSGAGKGANDFTAAVKSLGVWKSPRSEYRLTESDGILTLRLIGTSSAGIKDATGFLVKSGSGYRGSINIKYYNGRTLSSQMSARMINDETMTVTADQVYWNRYGLEISRRPTTFFMRRQTN